MKIVFKVLLWLLIGLVIALLLVPYLFKGQLLTAIKDTLNEELYAEVDFEDVNLSLFKNFPAVSVGIDNVAVTGVDQFAGKTLFTANNISVTTDFKSLIKSQEGINVKSIYVDKPLINVIVNKDGSANYDIVKDKTDSQSGGDTFGQIEKYEIKNGNINYLDNTSGLKAVITDLNHQGRGNFKNVVFDLETETQISALSFTAQGIPYLNKAKVDSKLDLGIDLDKSEYVFKENNINLNDLEMALTGKIREQSGGYNMDVAVSAPNNSVSSILSLVPSAYKGEFQNISSTGNSFLEGTINGLYTSDPISYPKINLKANIDNGTIKYPDLALPVKDINLDVAVGATQSDWSDLTIDLSKLTFLINEDRMSSQMKITNGLNNPNIVGLINGSLNLPNLSEAFPVKDMKLKDGDVKINMAVNANSNDIINQNYGAMELSGELTASKIDLKYAQWPLKIKEINTKLNPKEITNTVAEVEVGNSDFNGTVFIQDPLAFIQDSTLSVNTKIDLTSKQLDLDELMALNESTSATESAIEPGVPDLYNGYKVTGSYKANEIKYENYDLNQLRTDFVYAKDAVDLSSTSFMLNGSKMQIRGEASNIMDYVTLNEKIKGKFFFEADKLNLDDYLSETGETSTESELFIVDKNMELTIYPEVGEITYGQYVLNDLEGKIELLDGIAQLKEGTTKTLGGKINMDGIYDTSNPNQPAFDLRYKLDQLSYQKLFEISESFKKLAPIAQYIDGAFNSTLVMAGPLTKEMLPDLTKVTASGFLETLQGNIQGFEPIEKIGNAIGVDKLKSWTLKGTKNWFDVRDGFVILKPHDHQIDDMIFTVAGNHGIDQTLDYTINAKIPRDKLRKDKLGKNLEFGMDFLEKEASSRGVNIDLGEMIYLDIFLTGTLKSPKLKVIPVGSGGKTLNEVVKDEITKQIDVLKDTVRTELENKTEVLKDSVTKVIVSKTDTIKKQAEERVKVEVDRQKDKLKDAFKDKLDTTVTKVLTDSLEGKVLDRAKDVLGDDSKETVDDLKDKIKDWNPFKKKKGGN